MDKEKMKLAKYRLEQSCTCIRSAKILLDSTDYKGAANRAYYAIFHCMRSVLALDGHDFAKYSGVSAYFRREYIKTGIFDVEFSDIMIYVVIVIMMISSLFQKGMWKNRFKMQKSFSMQYMNM